MRLNEKDIRGNLDDLFSDLPIILYKITDSTNTRAKEYAESGFGGNAVFIASEQTAGRGRLGRSFISDEEKGLYLSILLGKDAARLGGLAITTYMSVIACRVLERLSPIAPQIKWVNDIYVGGKKLSGILTEGKIDPASGALDYAVCGIGINLFKQSFDDEVRKIATTLEDESGEKIDMNHLVAELLREFFKNLPLVGTKEIAKEYKKRSFLIGKDVRVIKANGEYNATVLDITDECELVVKTSDGITELLFTGEVSLKLN